jgi:predicted transglutaminase-like cysteine proteinase
VAATCQPLKLLVFGAVLALAVWSSDLQAAFRTVPRAVKNQPNQLRLDLPVLAPMAHVRFCLRYHEECEVRRVDFRRRNIALTPKRRNELNVVNRKVNREIIPEPNLGGVLAEEWLLSPKAGDCNDYAVTKRHMLTKNTDLVLDNLSANVRPVSMTYRQYQWVRIESPQNPRFWASVRFEASPLHDAD